MQRFTSRFIIAIFFFTTHGYAEEKKFYLIPVDEITKEKNYSEKDLQTIFQSFVNSYDAKALWGYSQKSKIQGKQHSVSGISLPASIVGTAVDDLAAYCYRCGLAREDLVRKEDCARYEFSWNVSSLDKLKKICN